MFSSRLSLSQARILKRIWQDFFRCQPVGINLDVQGYNISESGCYILGLRAGPSCMVSNLLHEMGHLAEREVDKLLRKPRYGWGYYYGKPWSLMGQSGFEPDNDKGTMREARICAFQLSLCRHYQITDFIDPEDSATECYQLIDSLVHLTDWYMYKHRVLSKADREALGYSESEKKAVGLLADHIEHLARTEFTFDAFREAWFVRMKALGESSLAKAA